MRRCLMMLRCRLEAALQVMLLLPLHTLIDRKHH
jgi:hypothetical protein